MVNKACLAEMGSVEVQGLRYLLINIDLLDDLFTTIGTKFH